MKAGSRCHSLTTVTAVAALLFILLVVPQATAVVAFDAVPSNGLAPLTVQFTDRSGPDPENWRWHFGDGVTSTEQNPIHTYVHPGTYTAQLTVAVFSTDPHGDPDTHMLDGTHVQTIVVDPIPTPSIPIPTTTTIPPTTNPIITSPTPSRTPVAGFSFSPQNGTAPLEVEFEGQGYDPDGYWDVARMTWDFGDRSPTEEGQRVNHTFVEPDAYTVRLTVFFSGLTNFQKSYNPSHPSQVTATANRTVLVEAAWIEIDAVTDIYKGDTFELTGSTNIAPGKDLLVMVLPSSIQLIDKTQARNSSGATGATRVVGGGTANTFRFTVDTSGFRPDTYTVTVEAVETDATATTTFDLVERSTDIPTTIITTLTTTPTTPPTPTLTTHPTLLSESPPTAAFTWEADEVDPLRINFTDASSGTVTAWHWGFGDGTTSGVQNPLHVYPQAGTYPVGLTAEGPGGASTVVRDIAIGKLDTSPTTPMVTATTVPPTVTVATVTPTVTHDNGDGEFPWWLLAVAAAGLLAGGVAVAKGIGRSPPAEESRVPGLTIEARGGLRRPKIEEPPRRREAQIEIDVRGGMRRER